MILPLNENEGYNVKVEPAPKGQCKYTFYKNKTEIKRIQGRQPIELNTNTAVWKQLQECIDPNDNFKKDKIRKHIDNEVIQILQNYYETIIIANQQLEQDEIREKQTSLKNKVNAAEEKLKSLDNPLLYIGSVVEWFTAGERNNILLCFLAYCSQVILRNPISVIALGEAGSGKSHIEEVAMSLIPREFIVNEKNITANALFRRAEESKYFYDGKIVNYGDMGGNSDQKFMEESKNLMKELQSEGYLCKPLTVQVEGEWYVNELELIGKPCLTYTTVPNYQFDEQELSRSIFITPRTDNKVEFNKRNISLEFKGKSYTYMEQMKKEAEQIPFMVYVLRGLMEEIEIINPYIQIVINFLNNSKYYKRDFPKYNNLLKVITVMNYYHKTVYEIGERRVIYTSIEDVQLFLSLLDNYRLSISENLSPKATEILKLLVELNDKPKSNGEQPTLDVNRLWTISEFMEETHIDIEKRSLQTYFSELNKKGFIRIVETKGRANVYEITDNFNPVTIEEKLTLSDNVKETIAYEYDDDNLLHILQEDKVVPGLSIMDHDDNILIPNW